jgi:serine/threonine-protein kinase
MGLVFEGTHLELGSAVAIKVVRPQFSRDSYVLERFVNEARNVAGLTSPHIARVFDAGKLDTGEAYLVMERLVGQDLATRLQESGPLPWTTAVSYVVQACMGLSEAHAHGIVHRDLKPEHLFIVQTGTSPPLVKVLDFGISKNTRDVDARMTLPGDSIGSPLYMSPEQAQNPAFVDERTDVWSLGVVLYEALSAKLPFEADTVAQVQLQILAAEPRPLRTVCPEAPVALERVIERCLSKSPDQRFASIDELRLALLELSEPAPERVISTPDPTPALAEAGIDDRAFARDFAEAQNLALSAAPTSEEPTSEELRAAGLPRGRGVAAAAFMAVGLALALVALGSVALGGFDKIKVWQQGLTQEQNPSRFEEVTSPWTPPLQLPLLKSGRPTEPTVTTIASEPVALQTNEVPAAVPSTTPPRPSVAGPRPAPARKAQSEQPQGLSPEQVEERYRNWLKQEKLVPVDEVTLDDALSPPVDQ